MRALQGDRQTFGHETGPNEFSSSAACLLLPNVDVLINLARAVRKTGTVPNFDGRPRSPAARASTRSSTRISNSRPSVEEHVRSSASPAPGPPRPSSSSRDSRSSEIAKSQTPSSVSHIRVSSRFSSEEAPWPKASSIVGSTTSNRPSSGVDASRVLIATPTDNAGVEIERKSINERPPDEVLQMVSSKNHQRLQGSIKRQDGTWQPVTGILEPEQTFNFMTDLRASELGLLSMVDPCTDEDDQTYVVQSLSGRRIRPIGTLRVQWGVPQSRPFSVVFQVFTYSAKRDLVLGEPFAKERKNYRERDARSRQQDGT